MLTTEIEDEVGGVDVVVVDVGILSGKPGYSTKSSCLIDMNHLANLADSCICFEDGVGSRKPALTIGEQVG